MEFLANGQIGKITILSKLDDSVYQNTLDALRKIRFLPAEVDGKKVDVEAILDYSFEIKKN